MRDLLLFVGSSFGLALLALWILYRVPSDILFSTFLFAVAIPLAGALLIGLYGAGRERKG